MYLEELKKSAEDLIPDNELRRGWGEKIKHTEDYHAGR